MNILFREILAAVCENGRVTVKKKNVCVSGNRIISVGNIPDDFKADKTFDGGDRLLIPGFINSHTHVYMTVFRNGADDLMFNDWLFGKILPWEDKLSAGDYYWGTMLGACEMIRSGTTSYLDMYISSREAVEAARDSGLRAVLSKGLSGDSANDKGGLERLRIANNDIAEFSGCGDGRLTFMLAPHAPYTCASDYLSLVSDEAMKLGIGIHTHISESRSEIQTIREKYGCTPVEYMEKTGLFKNHTIAAHCVYVTDSDMDIFLENGVSVATNPVSNMKLGNGFAPVEKMLSKGINVALGTDSAASNNNLNMLRELGFLTLIHKGANENAVSITAEQGFKMATVNGAKALGLSDVGEIREGMKADLSVIDLNCPQLNPRTDLISALSYSANGGEVEAVIVDGNILMENRELKTIDEERAIYETNKIYDRISK